MAAAQAAGMHGKFFNANGSITTANQGIATAISQKAAGIAIWAIDPRDVAGELTQAKAAHIPVIDVNDGSPTATPIDGVFGHVTSNWTQVGRWFADYMLNKTGCKLEAGVFSISSIPIFVQAQNGIVAEVKRLCPTCKVHIADIDIATVATSLGPLVQTMLTRYPNINYMTPIADTFDLLVEPAIVQAGKSVPLISHDGSAPALQEIRAGTGLLKATISTPPPPYYGWAMVDQLGRAIAGQPPAIWALPNQIIDKSDIGTSDAQLFPAYAGFGARFKKAWGVS